MNDSKAPRKRLGIIIAYFPAPVSRPIIHQNYFIAVHILGQHRLNAGIQRFFALIYRYNNGKQKIIFGIQKNYLQYKYRNRIYTSNPILVCSRTCIISSFSASVFSA